VLRLLFICVTLTCRRRSRFALACAFGLRLVRSSRSARAFVVGEAAMSQRITRPRPGSPPPAHRSKRRAAIERAERLAAVAAMIYLVFNEGYSPRGRGRTTSGAADRGDAAARLLLRLFPAEPESWA